jgi:hypothetical protein
MKKALKYLDFTFLRLLPMFFLIILFFFSVHKEFKVLNSNKYYSYHYGLDNILPVVCFLFLAIISVLKWFKKTIKYSRFFEYFVSAIAVIQIYINIIDIVEKNKLLDPNQYLPYFSEAISFFQNELECVALLILVVCCLLKNKFIKTKWILAILAASIIFLVDFCAMVSYSSISLKVWLDNVSNPIFWLGIILIYFSKTTAIILGLAPAKQDKVHWIDLTSERITCAIRKDYEV